MGLTQDDRNTPARDERQAPRDECLAHDQAAVGKEPTSIGGSKHLYDSIYESPCQPQGDTFGRQRLSWRWGSATVRPETSLRLWTPQWQGAGQAFYRTSDPSQGMPVRTHGATLGVGTHWSPSRRQTRFLLPLPASLKQSSPPPRPTLDLVSG